MTANSDDKQHKATSKRVLELRKKGNVMRSRDLASGLVFIVAVSFIANISLQFKAQIKANFTQSFSSIKHVSDNNDFIFVFLKKMAISNFTLLLPLLATIFFAILLSPFLFGGWNFTLASIHFNLGKLNPITNLKNIFSPGRMLTEIAKSALKASFILGALVVFFFSNKTAIFSLVGYSYKDAIGESYHIIFNFMVLLGFSIIILVLVDVMIHYFQYQHQIKMTTQELKDEYKESEGNMDIKRKIRSTQLQLLKQRMTMSVPKANVIITNPTHYSIALRYDDKKDHAPRVVAKGKGATASQIKTIAISNGIPIYEAPGLARAIYHTTKVGFEIHPALYMAVAIILSYVHQLKNYQMGLGHLPTQVNHFELPEEFIYDE